jgi:HlyD family secretion protein
LADVIPTRNAEREIRKHAFIGISAMAILFLGVGSWAATAPLAGAVIASGTIVVEGNVRKVQHPTGGIVGAIFVSDGTSVEEGQLLLRLDDTQVRASLGIVRSQLEELGARENRLLAERDGADTVPIPQRLADRLAELSVQTALSGEQRLFDARRSSRDGTRRQLRERIMQLREEITGLTSQREAKSRELVLVAEELSGVEELFRRNLIPRPRLSALQRDEARLQGEYGNLTAELARSAGRISEIEIQILQVDQEHRTEVLRDLREAQTRIAELEERRIAAEDNLRRVEIRAPAAGVVHELAAHTLGGIVGSGQEIMQIVPRTDRLVVSARVPPHDIDQVQVGSRATIRILAGNQRMMPELEGQVIRIGADLTREPQTGLSFYEVRLLIDLNTLNRLGDLKLQPGMPADSFIQTNHRTALEYIAKPLTEQLSRSFRER